nr:MAG TPA: hypothetical protein [Bacteriophage sp.]
MLLRRVLSIVCILIYIKHFIIKITHNIFYLIVKIYLRFLGL